MATNLHIEPPVREETACLTVDELAGYAQDRLPVETRSAAAAHLQQCEFCREALEGFASFSDPERIIPTVRSLNDEIRKRTSLPSAKQSLFMRNWNFYVPLAAMVIIGLVSVLYFTREKPYEKLFAEHFQPYPTIDQTIRGEQPGSELTEAFNRYEVGDFKAAAGLLRALQARTPQNDTINFYAGVSELATGNAGQAIADFRKVLLQPEVKLHEAAKWYLGLAYLKADDLERARAVLSEIVLEGGFYHKHAQALLARVATLESTKP